MTQEEEKQLEVFMGKVLTKDLLEKPSVNFTDTLMARVEDLQPKTPSIIYKPLIGKWVWYSISLAFAALVIYLLNGSGSTGSNSFLDTYNVSQYLQNPFSGFDFSSIAMYSTLFLALMLGVQVVFLKQEFNKRISL